MENIFNITNLKSLITFTHLTGLAIGVGGAWILDAFIIKHMNKKISQDKYYIIEFISKFILTGLLLLWVSGLAFIGYYYLYTPELLLNQKIWGKLFIVVILSFNGVLVHKMILPKIKKSIGTYLLNSLEHNEIKIISVVGVISFISWLFPIILGVTKTLNFSVPATHIISFYLGSIVLSSIAVNLVSTHLFQIKPAN